MALVQNTTSLPHTNLSEFAATRDSSAASTFQSSRPSTAKTQSGHERQMSFQMSSFGTSHNPYPVPANYAPANGARTPQPSHTVDKDDISKIYLATYSGIKVYEMKVKDVHVMRRLSDSWLNATQILNVAGIDKGKRTKILEKEILPGKHEKVQGGYGRYQGTWIEYERGRDFCRQYGVDALIRPLLEYDMGQDGQSKGILDTPTKEQVMAAQRKKMLGESRLSNQSPNGTFFKNISSTAANAVQAINKSRFDSPATRPGSAQKPRPSLARSLSQQRSNQDSFHPSSQQSMHSLHSEHSLSGSGHLDHTFGNLPNPYLSQGKRPSSALGSQEPPRKRMRSESSTNTLVPSASAFPTDSMTIMENPNHSYGRHTDALGVAPLPPPTGSAAQKRKASLLSLIMVDEEEEIANHPTFDQVSGQDLDMPMDNSGHTALVWAATLGRLSLVRKLVSEGANVFRVNVGGETALMKAASAVNNYERGTFPELLEILGPTIEMRDGRGRTVLHHIAIASAIKGRSKACKYYLESLLEFVVRQGSASSSGNSSHTTEANGLSHGQMHKKVIGLARFMSDVVNAQEMSGDTALNMAARNGNRALAQQLLEVGADPSIANNGGLKPTDFGIEGVSAESALSQVDGVPATVSTPDDAGSMGPPPTKKFGSKVAESGLEVLNAMQAIIEDAKSSYLAEARAKQALIDEARKKLTAAREQLTAEQARVQELRHRKSARVDLRNQLENLLRANRESTNEIFKLTHATPKTQVKVGDADAGLWIDPSFLPLGLNVSRTNGINGDGMDVDNISAVNGETEGLDAASLTTEQIRYGTGTLSPSHFLRARLSAYQTNNDHLKREAATLAQKSSLLSAQVKRILSISVGVPEGRISEMLPGLITAIESEPGEVDMARVREFLRRVEDDEAGSDGE